MVRLQRTDMKQYKTRKDFGIPQKRIDFIEKDGCFVCTSHKYSATGYPVIRSCGKLSTVARYIYEECFGFIPQGLLLRHKCDNRQCINPEHLELGTHYDNMHDMISRGRARHPSMKGIVKRPNAYYGYKELT